MTQAHSAGSSEGCKLELAARGVGRTVSFLSLRVIDPVASVDLGTCGKGKQSLVGSR
jgi:hypothetical protein